MYIPQIISSTDQIQKELEGMQIFLEATYASDNPAAAQNRLDDLGVYMARSGKLKADAEHHYNTVIESSIIDVLKKAMEDKLSATTINKFVEAAARNYKFLLTWADRINRTCTHQYEGCRTVISALKAERYSTGYGK